VARGIEPIAVRRHLERRVTSTAASMFELWLSSTLGPPVRRGDYARRRPDRLTRPPQSPVRRQTYWWRLQICRHRSTEAFRVGFARVARPQPVMQVLFASEQVVGVLIGAVPPVVALSSIQPAAAAIATTRSMAASGWLSP